MNNDRKRKPNHLSSVTFDQLLNALHPDRELAATQYEHLRRALLIFFEIRGSTTPAEDADETFDRVARRLSEGKEIFATTPRSYFYAVAQNIWRERLVTIRRDVSLGEAEANIPGRLRPLTPQEILDKYEDQRLHENRLRCLSQCLAQLKAPERDLIETYYQGVGRIKIDNRLALAQRLGIPPNALRLRAMRLREKLESCVTRCLRQ